MKLRNGLAVYLNHMETYRKYALKKYILNVFIVQVQIRSSLKLDCRILLWYRSFSIPETSDIVPVQRFPVSQFTPLTSTVSFYKIFVSFETSVTPITTASCSL